MRTEILTRLKRAAAALRSPWVRRAGEAVMLAACAWYAWRNWDRLLEAARGLTLRADLVAASLVFYTAALLLGIFSWYFILRALGSPVSLRQSAAAHLGPVLSKYLPGYAWQYVGKGYLSSQAGVPPRRIIAAFTLEFVLIVWTGAGLGALLLPATGFAALLPGLPPVWLSAAGGLLLVLLVVAVLAANRLLPWLGGANVPQSLDRLCLARAVAILTISWFLLGASFWCTFGFFAALRWETYAAYTAAYAIAYLVGWLIVFIPNGLGVREGVLMGLLGSVAPPASILSTAIILRFIQLGGDVLGYLLGLAVLRRDKSANP